MFTRAAQSPHGTAVSRVRDGEILTPNLDVFAKTF